ncbi:MAG: riboflavin kinase [Patescibacteria group bacterium]
MNYNLFLMLIPLTFPLYLVKFRIGVFPVTVPEILVLLAGLWFVAHNLKLGNWRTGLRVPRSMFYVPIFFLAFAFFISLFVTPHDFLVPALGIVKSWFVIPVVYFFLLWRQFSDVRSFYKVFDFYSLSAVFLAGWGIYQYATGLYATPDMRASGPFESANYLAFYLVPAAMYSFLMAVQTFKNRVEKLMLRMSIVYFLSALILFFALYQTKSFGAFLGLAAGFFVYFILYFSGHSHFWKKFSAVCVLIFFVGGMFFATGDSKKFEALFRFHQQSSSAVRLQVWTVAGDFIAQHPILGIGLGTFQNLYEKNAPAILGVAPYEASMLHPHNVFLMFWISTGLLGLLSFLWLIWCFFAAFFRLPSENRLFGMILFALMTAIPVHGLVDTPIWKNDLALIFWTLCAAMFGLVKSMKVTGIVVPGLGLGRQFGFPTLNLEFDVAPLLDHGVYACRARGSVQAPFLPALLHFGPRPTIDLHQPTFEVFFLEFPEGENIKTLEVEVLGKLRGVLKYTSIEALADQIRKDREQAMVEYFRAEFPSKSHFGP